MKILFSPSKELNLDGLVKRKCDIHLAMFYDKLQYFNDLEFEQLVSYAKLKTKKDFQDINVYSKQAIKLYNGLSFRQLQCLDDEFYNDVIILSSLYGYSYGHDYISPYRLDYTSKLGKLFYKEIYGAINELLTKEDIIINLASKEFSSGVVHDNIIDFKFLNQLDKEVSAISKKMRGKMLEYIRVNGINKLDSFNIEGWSLLSNQNNCYIYKLGE